MDTKDCDLGINFLAAKFLEAAALKCLTRAIEGNVRTEDPYSEGYLLAFHLLRDLQKQLDIETTLPENTVSMN